jgi:aminoglycoside/choline kinase family phosphotransferase
MHIQCREARNFAFCGMIRYGALDPSPRAVMSMPPDHWWIERVQRSAARVRPGADLHSIDLLPRHASMRRYARVIVAGRSEVALLTPPPSNIADEAGPPSDDFLAARDWLAGLGLPVPALYAVDDVEAVWWLEDAGTEDFDMWFQRTGTSCVDAYAAPVELLLQFQRATKDVVLPDFVAGRRFDKTLLLWELEHYRDWRLVGDLGLTLTSGQTAALQHEFEVLANAVAQIPQVVIHRDFQSHNLMVHPDGKLRLLDFQDVMLGPVVYDAVALLRDSYIEIPPAQLHKLVDHWATGASGVHGVPAEQLVSWFYLQTLQRKLKDAGRFVYIDRIKGNSSFLKYIPASLRYVRDTLSRVPQAAALAELLRTFDPELRTPRED